MAKFRLSRLAEADLMDIGTYSLDKWGEDQTIRYIDALEACCQQLGNSRAGPRLRSDPARLASHGTRESCCFLPIEARGILVSRILHQRMLPERQSIDEES